jgi:uncharacterized RDD family membrane protein YckC
MAVIRRGARTSREIRGWAALATDEGSHDGEVRPGPDSNQGEQTNPPPPAAEPVGQTTGGRWPAAQGLTRTPAQAPGPDPAVAWPASSAGAWPPRHVRAWPTDPRPVAQWPPAPPAGAWPAPHAGPWPQAAGPSQLGRGPIPGWNSGSGPVSPGGYPGWNAGGYPGWNSGGYPGWNPQGYVYYAPPPPGPVPGVAWAGMGSRFGALLIDGVVIFGALIVMSILMTGLIEAQPYGDDYSGLMIAVSLGWWLLVLFYHPASWYFLGASLGQRALGLRVLRAADGRKLGIGAVLIRFALFAVSTALLVPGIIAGAMAANDPYKRAWHDEAARSVVVHRLW